MRSTGVLRPSRRGGTDLPMGRARRPMPNAPIPNAPMPAGSRRPIPRTSTCRFRGSRRSGCARARARCPSSCVAASPGASAMRSIAARPPRSGGGAGCNLDTPAGTRRRTGPRVGPWRRDRRVALCGVGGCIVPCARIGRTTLTRPAQGLTRSRACVKTTPNMAGQRGQSAGGWLKKAQGSPGHDLVLREAAQVRATFLAAWRTARSCLSANAARRGPSWTRRPRTAQAWA